MTKGKFISIEGPDGSGKTSVLKALAQLLRQDGIDLITTREPGGSPIAEQIRDVILHVDNTAMDYRTEALLYAAQRRQHLVETIIPNMDAGKMVITDRFVDSSIAYQGVARDLPVEEVWKVNQFAIQDYMPQLTLLIDVPAEVGIQRIHAARGQRQFDRLDRESIDFHNRVRQAFLDLHQRYDRIHLIDGNQSIQEVAQDCYKVMKNNGII